MDRTFLELKEYMIGVHLRKQTSIEIMLKMIIQNNKLNDEMNKMLKIIGDELNIYDLPKIIILSFECVKKFINIEKHDCEFLRYVIYGLIFFTLINYNNSILDRIENTVLRFHYDDLFDLCKYNYKNKNKILCC